MYLIIGLVIVVVIVVLYLKMKPKKQKTISVIDDKVKARIQTFINEIISDYYNEYRINYLSVRFNIRELESNKSYAFKTKRIGTLKDILEYSKVPLGIKYLDQFIQNKYSVNISENNQLPFITEITRIEGKIKAVESVKHILNEEDYTKLITELNEDITYYKDKYVK